MPKKDSQEHDDNGIGKQLEGILAEVAVVVRKVCHNLGYHPDAIELDDLVQIIILVLIDKDFQTLDSFEHRSEIQTWLYTVARRHILHRLQNQNRLVRLDDLAPDSFAAQPDQEETMISEEREDVLHEAIGKLTMHEQNLFNLLRQGLKAREIAAVMGIGKRSVYTEKSSLIKKLRSIIKR